MRPLCLVESRSQDVAANAGVLSVYLATILYDQLQLSIDIKRENIHCVSLLKLPVTINLYEDGRAVRADVHSMILGSLVQSMPRSNYD